MLYVTGSYSRLYAVDARTGEKKWKYNARLPEGILPCCDVVNRGAALYKDKVYFGTLDAKLVALDQKTGKVVWRKDIDDFKSGYSYTAAPIIVKGKIITGVSGGEFGVVGRVEARDAETGEWCVGKRPVIEGHVGELNGKPSTMTARSTRAGRATPGSSAAVPPGSAEPTIPTEPDLFRHRQSRPWNSALRPATTVVGLAPRHQPDNARDRLGLPDHAA